MEGQAGNKSESGAALPANALPASDRGHVSIAGENFTPDPSIFHRPSSTSDYKSCSGKDDGAAVP